MNDLSSNEIKLIEALRNAPRYADISIQKRPTKHAPDGDIISVGVFARTFFDPLSTPQTKPE